MSSKNDFTQQLQSGIKINANTANQRLDRFLRKLFRPYPDISLVMIFKAIRTGQIKLNDRKVDQSKTIKEQDSISFHPSFLDLITNKNPIKKDHKSKTTSKTYDLEQFQSRIISEDDDRLVINKPAGISIHPGQTTNLSQAPASLHDLIKQYYSSRGFAGSMFQPNVAYRLDKETS